MNELYSLSIRDLLDTTISSLLDEDFVQLRRPDLRTLRPMLRLLGESSGRRFTLPRTLSRNSFLCGCLHYTEYEQREHLIVGYGTKRGSGTVVRLIQHAIGTRDSVAIPIAVREMIAAHTEGVGKSEILVFHNHPWSPSNPLDWLMTYFDVPPLASASDRRVMVQYRYIDPVQAVRLLLNIGGIRFYLARDGLVREIRAPLILELLDQLKQ